MFGYQRRPKELWPHFVAKVDKNKDIGAGVVVAGI